jgi:hypothetical protein
MNGAVRTTLVVTAVVLASVAGATGTTVGSPMQGATPVDIGGSTGGGPGPDVGGSDPVPGRVSATATSSVTGTWNGTVTTYRVDGPAWTAGEAVRVYGGTLTEGYLLGGASGTGATDRTATVWRLTPSGDVDWTRTFGAAGPNASITAMSTDVIGGDTIIVGTRYDTATGHDAFAARIESNGSLTWQWASNETGAQYGVDVVADPDGGYAIAVTDAGTTGEGDVELVGLDAATGTQQWRGTDTRAGDQRAAAVSVGANGTGYLIGGLDRSRPATDDRALLVRTDGDGTVLSRSVAVGDVVGVTRGVTDLRVSPDGGYLGVGSVVANSTDAALFAADDTGLSSTTRVGVDPLDERADAFALRPFTDGYVIAGHQARTTAANGTAWLAGVTPAGTVEWRQTAAGGSNAAVTTRGTLTFVAGTRTGSDGPADGDAVVLVLDPAGPGSFSGGVPGVQSGQAPTDPDGDGVYEDVDGDGALTYNDVVALGFADLDAIAADPLGAAAFDVDGDGQVGFVDVIALFNELR